jgi:simple sugar transport system permease protein/ribose transport system permease protein
MIVVVFIIAAIFVPKFILFKNIVNIVFHTTILGYLVLASGIVLMVGAIDLSLESTLAFAPCFAIILSLKVFPGMNIVFIFLLTFLFGTALGAFNGLLVTKLQMNSLIATLAMMIIVRGLVRFIVPTSIVDVPESYLFVGAAWIGSFIPVAIIFFFGIYILFALMFRYTLFGQFLSATGGNPTASFIAGINIHAVKMLTFAIAGLLAGFAGLAMTGRIGSVNNMMGEGYALMAFAGAILGGVSFKGGQGTVIGMLGGALLLGMFDNILNLLAMDVFLISVIKGCLILFAVVIDSLKAKLRIFLLSSKIEKTVSSEIAKDKMLQSQA